MTSNKDPSGRWLLPGLSSWACSAQGGGEGAGLLAEMIIERARSWRVCS